MLQYISKLAETAEESTHWWETMTRLQKPAPAVGLEKGAFPWRHGTKHLLTLVKTKQNTNKNKLLQYKTFNKTVTELLWVLMYILCIKCALSWSSSICSIPFYRWRNSGSVLQGPYPFPPWHAGHLFLFILGFRHPTRAHTTLWRGKERLSYLQGPVTIRQGLLVLPKFYVGL